MKIKFMFHTGDSNKHGKDFATIHGPRIKYARLTVQLPNTGHRLILYFPSGYCWYQDVYFDRRGV